MSNERPSDNFLMKLCSNGGTPAITCGCGQFWFAEAFNENYEACRADPDAKEADGDSVHVSHFQGVVWVDGCDCRIARWLAFMEEWLLDNATDIGRFYTDHARQEHGWLAKMEGAAFAIGAATHGG